MIQGVTIGNVLIVGLEPQVFDRALNFMHHNVSPLFTPMDLYEFAADTETINGTPVHDTITYLSEQNNNY